MEPNTQRRHGKGLGKVATDDGNHYICSDRGRARVSIKAPQLGGLGDKVAMTA